MTETPMPTSFKTDIAPIFAPFYAQMLWRFDLRDYEQVKANAILIDAFITADPDFPRMPPPNYGDPLTGQQIKTFKQWIAEGCPP
jgi:hypothetical protein